MGAEADVYRAVEVATSTALSVAAVRAWLEGMEPQAICGTSHAHQTCPLATYLSQAHEGRESYVDVFYYWVRDHVGRRCYAETPEWGQRFVFAVDRAAPSRPSTAQEALELLRRVEHPPGGVRSPGGPMTSEQWIKIEEVYAAILAADVGLAAAFPAEHLHPRERHWRDPHSRRAIGSAATSCTTSAPSTMRAMREADAGDVKGLIPRGQLHRPQLRHTPPCAACCRDRQAYLRHLAGPVLLRERGHLGDRKPGFDDAGPWHEANRAGKGDELTRLKATHELGPRRARPRPARTSSSTSCGAGCSGPAGARRRSCGTTASPALRSCRHPQPPVFLSG